MKRKMFYKKDYVKELLKIIRTETILLDNNRKIWKRQPPKNNFYGKVFFSFLGENLKCRALRKWIDIENI